MEQSVQPSLSLSLSDTSSSSPTVSLDALISPRAGRAALSTSTPITSPASVIPAENDPSPSMARRRNYDPIEMLLPSSPHGVRRVGDPRKPSQALSSFELEEEMQATSEIPVPFIKDLTSVSFDDLDKSERKYSYPQHFESMIQSLILSTPFTAEIKENQDVDGNEKSAGNLFEENKLVRVEGLAHPVFEEEDEEEYALRLALHQIRAENQIHSKDTLSMYHIIGHLRRYV